MKDLFVSFTLALACCTAAQSAPSTGKIPSLDDLAGDWMQVDSLRSFPAVNNFVGGLQSTPNLTAFKFLTLPPYAQEDGWAASR